MEKCHFRLYPEVFPRPEIEVLPMNVPLINPKTDLSVQEADLMVNRNLEGTVTGIFDAIEIGITISSQPF